MVIMPYDGGRLSPRRINASGIHNVYTVDKLGTVKVSMTVKSYLTAVLLGNSDKRVKSLMHMMLVAVHTKYLECPLHLRFLSFCCRQSHSFPLRIKSSFRGMKIPYIVESGCSPSPRCIKASASRLFSTTWIQLMKFPVRIGY